MVDFGAISAVASSLNTLKNMAEAMIAIRDASTLQEERIKFQDVVIKAQASISTAYEERSTLVQRVSDLEKEIADLKAWNGEKQRYELKKLSEFSNALAYALKPDAQPPEEPHYICANCYNHQKKSLLQHERRSPGRIEAYVCHRCKTDLITVGSRSV